MCKVKITLKTDRNLNSSGHIINCYTATEPKCDRDPLFKESFYNNVSSLANTVCERGTLIDAGDFNVKTGSG